MRFDFFINLRPIRSCRSLLHTPSLRPEMVEDLDILVVRELVSGIYFGATGRDSDEQGAYGYQTMCYGDRSLYINFNFLYWDGSIKLP